MIDTITLRFAPKPAVRTSMVAGPVIAATVIAMELADLVDDAFRVVAYGRRGDKLGVFNYTIPKREMAQYAALRDARDIIVTKSYGPGDQIAVLAKLARG